MTLYNINYALTYLLLLVVNISMLNAQGLDWSQCAIDANKSYWNAPNDTFLYNQYGKPTANMSQAWGVSYESCRGLCGTPVNTGNYNWNSLSQGLTSWLLPWLALTAQLPFETKDKQTNLMALFLALGSPALITYSLALTILDARWINQKFRHIKENSESLRPDRRHQTEAIKAARVFLIESQHIPIQIVNGPRREFAQLVACPENWTWWCSLQKEIRKTKRQWTYSLYAQIGLVCVSQLLAIVDFFTIASFNTSIGIGLAINSLWIWMIPVVLGWVYIGTQTSAGSIKAALTSINVPVLGTVRDVNGQCIGIRDRTTSDESSTFLGFSMTGCELEPGPIFNYARIWSHMNAVEHVARAFSAVIRRQEERRTVQGQPWNDNLERQDENFRGSPEELSRYIYRYEDGEDTPNLSIYGRSSPKLVLNCITTAFIAIFLQWSSTGAAIIIAYK